MSNLDAMTAFFAAENWACEPSADGDMLHTRFKGSNGEWRCLVQTSPDGTRVMFYSILGNNVPPPQRAVVAELLTRANYGLILGNWEMDFSDGEVRYKTSAFTGAEDISPENAAALCFTNILTTDRYLPALMGVLFGQLSPEEAIANVEG